MIVLSYRLYNQLILLNTPGDMSYRISIPSLPPRSPTCLASSYLAFGEKGALFSEIVEVTYIYGTHVSCPGPSVAE